MSYIFDGIKEALELIISFDKELYSIIFLSLFVSITATFISTIISIPTGLIMATHEFKFKRLASKILYSFMGLPPVVLGLFVFLILARNGPLGSLQLLFTPSAMIIAQVLLVTPIITSLILNNCSEVSKDIISTCKTLGANRIETLIQLIKEVKVYVFIALVAGFSRAISEVGAVMIVGGNIKGQTRVMTTFIALNNSQGNYSISIAMGLILISLSFIIHSISYHYVIGEKNEY